MADLSESESLCALRSLGAASRMSVIMNRVRGARASRSSRCTVIATAPGPAPAAAAPAASSARARHRPPTATSTSLAPSSLPVPVTVPGTSHAPHDTRTTLLSAHVQLSLVNCPINHRRPVCH